MDATKYWKWKCPGCNRLFQVKLNRKSPELCDDCIKSGKTTAPDEPTSMAKFAVVLFHAGPILFVLAITVSGILMVGHKQYAIGIAAIISATVAWVALWVAAHILIALDRIDRHHR